ERQPQHARKPVDAATFAVPQPAGESPRFRLQTVAQHDSSQLRRNEHAVARYEPSRLGQLAMCRNEVGRREAVAVEKNAIVALAGEQGAGADFGRAKPAILLPDVAERNVEPGSPPLHHIRGPGTGPVIRDHDLEAA